MLLVAAPHDSGAEPVTFTGVMEHVAQAFEALGALILVIGVLWSLWVAVVAWRRTRQPTKGYAALRRAFGRTLLLGLEVLVAADLIRTVAVSPTLNNVLVLGLIVVMPVRYSATRCSRDVAGRLLSRVRRRSGSRMSTVPPGRKTR